MRTLLYLLYFLGHLELQSRAEAQIKCGIISHDFRLSCKLALSCQALFRVPTVASLRAIVCLSHNLSMTSMNDF